MTTQRLATPTAKRWSPWARVTLDLPRCILLELDAAADARFAPRSPLTLALTAGAVLHLHQTPSERTAAARLVNEWIDAKFSAGLDAWHATKDAAQADAATIAATLEPAPAPPASLLDPVAALHHRLRRMDPAEARRLASLMLAAVAGEFVPAAVPIAAAVA